jgi:hypothetical protein
MTKTVGTNTFTYDSAGNMATGFDLSGDLVNPPSRTMSYNVENMPSKILYTNNGVTLETRFYYDGEFGRVRKYIICVWNTGNTGVTS